MDDILLESLPLPLRLALSYAPRDARRETLVLLALDTRLAAIVRGDGEAIIAQLKLAWWRDRLAENPENWPAGEPLLSALSDWRGNLEALGELVDGWEGLLVESLGPAQVRAFAAARGTSWQTLADGLGGKGDPETVAQAGQRFALADLALHLGDPAERDVALHQLAQLQAGRVKLNRQMRPLAVLNALTQRALKQGSGELLDGPAAMALAMRVGITGR